MNEKINFVGDRFGEPEITKNQIIHDLLDFAERDDVQNMTPKEAVLSFANKILTENLIFARKRG